jgi:hypothetical protein
MAWYASPDLCHPGFHPSRFLGSVHGKKNHASQGLTEKEGGFSIFFWLLLTR